LLSSTRKDEIRLGLRKYNVQSIDVELVDPSYLYIVPSITVRYDSTKTSRTPGELAAAVASRVVSFESAYLSRFNQSFRYSKFLEYIDATDTAIETTNAVIRLRKTFNPSTTTINSYVINFNNAIQRFGTKELISGVPSHPGFGSITSTQFTYADETSYFDDNGFGTLRVYYKSSAGRLNRVYTNTTAGTIDYINGIVYINNFRPTSYSGSVVSVFAAPVSPNISPVRNQILLMSQSEVNIVDDASGKTVATATNVETIGETATLLTPQTKLYNF
jgi:hypothetical protein